MKLKNHIVVVTGAGAGIGQACAIEFAKEGANVVVADINMSSASKTVKIIEESGGFATAFKMDVSNESSVKDLVVFTLNTYKKINTLVNNAAVQVNKTIEITEFEEWNRQLAVNIGGVFLCSKYFLPYLRESKGNIINMSSVNGFFVEPSCAGYCATKAAIIGFTKAMAIDHGQDGIRVNCISPGYIDAGLAAGYFESQKNPALARSAAGKLHALGRIGNATEIGRMAVFLASEDASFITGANMVVDGGFGSGLPPQ